MAGYNYPLLHGNQHIHLILESTSRSEYEEEWEISEMYDVLFYFF